MKKLLSILLAGAMVLSFAVTAAAYGDELVTDAFQKEYTDGWGSYEFRVPQIEMDGDGIRAVNDEIWQALFQQVLIDTGALGNLEQGFFTGLLGMDYTWAVNGDVLSLVAAVRYDGDVTNYYVYNVSLSAGRKISDEELLQAVGVSQEEFHELAQYALGSIFQSDYGGFPEDGFKDEQRQATMSDGNVRAVRPYLDEQGNLFIIGWIYSLAGAERYAQQIELVQGDLLASDISTADLPETAPADDRLVYFLEHCDSEDLTAADIAGFDEQMCNYARNGVYARSGRMFQSAELQQFFEQFDWYEPTVDPASFTVDMLNAHQYHNIALVQDYEAQQGY